jgi:hypothetical protein
MKHCAAGYMTHAEAVVIAEAIAKLPNVATCPN